MSRRKHPRRKAEVLAAQWIDQMKEECESVPSLVWQRVKLRFGLDLTDPTRCPPLIVYELLEPLRDRDRITDSLLAVVVDERVPQMFELPPEGDAP